MKTTDCVNSGALKEFEQALLKATPAEIEALLGEMDDEERIEAAVKRMQRGLANLTRTKSPDARPTGFAQAAFATVQNSPAQRSRVRLALAIALDQALGEKVGHTLQSVVALADDEVLALYETLRTDRKVP